MWFRDDHKLVPNRILNSPWLSSPPATRGHPVAPAKQPGRMYNPGQLSSPWELIAQWTCRFIEWLTWYMTKQSNERKTDEMLISRRPIRCSRVSSFKRITLRRDFFFSANRNISRRFQQNTYAATFIEALVSDLLSIPVTWLLAFLPVWNSTLTRSTGRTNC